MAFDFKKEYKEYYMPKNKPEIVNVPSANYIAVRGKGDPNDEDGEYKKAIGILYAVAYTIKMSKMGDHRIEGYFDYVVPPLEGFWWQENVCGIDYSDKSTFCWISVIRLPDFVTKEDFDWAVKTASEKKKLDCSKAEFMTLDEGLCVQIMHTGSFDDEPATCTLMDAYIAENGYENDFSESRIHHEIYLSDARKVLPEKWKTVIRHPVKKKITGENFYHNIETDRLLLKNITYDDRDFIIKHFSDDDVNEFLYDAEPISSIEEANELIGFYTNGYPKDRHRWIIIDKKTNDKIGTCGFHCLNDAKKSVDVGYDLQKSYWNKGIMTEAMIAILTEYTKKLDINHIYAHISLENIRSSSLAQKLGFVLSGETEALTFHGKDYVHNIYVKNV